MLAKYWRLRIRWDADQALTYNNGARINVRCCPWNPVNSSNVLKPQYGSTIVLDDDNWVTWGSDQTIADEGQVESDVQDNTTNLYAAIKGTIQVTADANSTDGTLYLYLEESDDNSLWPSDADDFDISHLRLIATLTFSTDAEDEDQMTNFEF